MKNNSFKHESELKFWSQVVEREHILESTSGGISYQKFYVTDLNIDADDFKNKNILDIGCGPRGSLEWADMANLRVGLDPLVNEYFKLDGGTLFHKMHYVRAYSENMPFPDETFDFVFSINSLDHVDDLDDTIHEIKRVLKLGGQCGIIVDANHKPTACEPISIDLNLKEKFLDIFEVEDERVYEVVYNTGFRDNLDNPTFYDFKNPKKRPAILLLKLKKVKEYKSSYVSLDEVEKLRQDNERLNSKLGQYKNRKAVKLADKTKSIFKR